MMHIAYFPSYFHKIYKSPIFRKNFKFPFFRFFTFSCLIYGFLLSPILTMTCFTRTGRPWLHWLSGWIYVFLSLPFPPLHIPTSVFLSVHPPWYSSLSIFVGLLSPFSTFLSFFPMYIIIEHLSRSLFPFLALSCFPFSFISFSITFFFHSLASLSCTVFSVWAMFLIDAIQNIENSRCIPILRI